MSVAKDKRAVAQLGSRNVARQLDHWMLTLAEVLSDSSIKLVANPESNRSRLGFEAFDL
jgi:hypothetical protein